MPTIAFTPNLERHIGFTSAEAGGATVREVLEAVFARHPQARGYVLDDQHALRKHMLIFVGGAAIKDRVGLSDPVPASASIFVMQSLSGG